MKTFALSAVLALATVSPAFAAGAKEIWDCTDGPNLEGAMVSEYNGRVFGNMSWDCWPGGGICGARGLLTVIRNEAGDLVYRSRTFSVVIHSSVEPVNGEYNAHLIATDEVDSAKSGRGFTYNEFVRCKLSQAQ